MNRLVVSLVVAALAALIVWRDGKHGRHDDACVRAVAAALVITFGVFELPLDWIDFPAAARLHPGLFHFVDDTAFARVLVSAPVVVGAWLLTLLAAGLLVVQPDHQRRALALAVAAGGGIVLGVIPRAAVVSGYHQGLIALTLAVVLSVLLSGRRPPNTGDLVFVTRVVVGVVYAACGFAKVRGLGVGFFDADTQFSFVASCLVQRCNALEAPLAAAWLAHSDAAVVRVFFIVVAVLTVAFELAAILLLWPRETAASLTFRRLLGAGALIFHVAVVANLGIVFTDFMILDVLLIATAPVTAQPSPRARRVAAVAVVALLISVGFRIKAWPLSPFEVFAAAAPVPLVWHTLVLETDGGPREVRVEDVVPGAASSSPRRWLAGCFGDEAAQSRCDAWLGEILARSGASAVLVEERSAVGQAVLLPQTAGRARRVARIVAP